MNNKELTYILVDLIIIKDDILVDVINIYNEKNEILIMSISKILFVKQVMGWDDEIEKYKVSFDFTDTRFSAIKLPVSLKIFSSNDIYTDSKGVGFMGCYFYQEGNVCWNGDKIFYKEIKL
jgi:hypothetical protein